MGKSSVAIASLKPSDLVAKVGLSRSYACELLKRTKTPSLDTAVKIERAFGVPVDAWLADTPADAAAQGEAA